MSKLESKITELERELALKKGFQAVKFVLPKGTPDDVATEIQSKLREIADGLALSKEQIASDSTPTTGVSAFTEQEVSTLKMLAETVLKKASPKGETPVASSVPTQAPYVPPVQKSYGAAKKGKVMVAENIRGENRKQVAPDDEIFVPNPDKVDEHGMVSATHMKRGFTMKIPVDDIEFTS